MYFSETEIIVRYAETDKMGVVHHSVYPVWFECGRTDWIKKYSITYSEIEKGGLMLPLLELNCKYKGWSSYEDVLIVKTYLKQSTATRITFGYIVYNSKDINRVIAEGETAHVWTNTELKPVNIKKHNPDIYIKLRAYFEDINHNN